MVKKMRNGGLLPTLILYISFAITITQFITGKPLSLAKYLTEFFKGYFLGAFTVIIIVLITVLVLKKIFKLRLALIKAEQKGEENVKQE